jgi:dihydroneopterin aldolase
MQCIVESSFQTLESMASFFAKKILDEFVSSVSPDAHVRLRLEKPMAIANAEAPAVEIVRYLAKSTLQERQQFAVPVIEEEPA